MPRYRHVLFVSDERDTIGLADAMAIAASAGAALTLAVPIYEPPGLAHLAPYDFTELREELREEAEEWASEALATAPVALDMSVLVLPPRCTAVLAFAMDCGTYDLCIARERRRGLPLRRATVATQLTRLARRRRVPTLALPPR
jgi:hypothetical protein